MRQLLESALERNPNQRLTATELLKHEALHPSREEQPRCQSLDSALFARKRLLEKNELELSENISGIVCSYLQLLPDNFGLYSKSPRTSPVLIKVWGPAKPIFKGMAESFSTEKALDEVCNSCKISSVNSHWHLVISSILELPKLCNLSGPQVTITHSAIIQTCHRTEWRELTLGPQSLGHCNVPAVMCLQS